MGEEKKDLYRRLGELADRCQVIEYIADIAADVFASWNVDDDAELRRHMQRLGMALQAVRKSD